jgi:hypothetical protein
MAKLKATTFGRIGALHTPDPFKLPTPELVLGHNTRSRVAIDGDGFRYFLISLHGHRIVELHHDVTRISLAGYPTVTTRERINQLLPPGYRVFQKAHTQYLRRPDGTVEALDSREWVDCPLV